ncbi:MAG: CBS domain-containing protein [Thermodesulfobacteriota bacterium]|nr:CBS domain-containing protein [Thermodesulfobacteriota bacterium]
MLRARDIMTTEILTVNPDMEITLTARLLLDNHINGVPVVDEAGGLVGILCRSDLIEQQKDIPLPSFFSLLDGFIQMTSEKHIKKQIQKITAACVSQAMTHDPVFVGPDTMIDEVAALMADRKFHTIPVVDQGKLVGVIGKEDVLKTLISE